MSELLNSILNVFHFRVNATPAVTVLPPSFPLTLPIEDIIILFFAQWLLRESHIN